MHIKLSTEYANKELVVQKCRNCRNDFITALFSKIYDESEMFHFIVTDLEVILSITVDQCIWSDSESVSSLQTLQGVCREMPTLVDSHYKV